MELARLLFLSSSVISWDTMGWPSTHCICSEKHAAHAQNSVKADTQQQTARDSNDHSQMTMCACRNGWRTADVTAGWNKPIKLHKRALLSSPGALTAAAVGCSPSLIGWGPRAEASIVLLMCCGFSGLHRLTQKYTPSLDPWQTGQRVY